MLLFIKYVLTCNTKRAYFCDSKFDTNYKDFWARGDGWLFAALAKIIPDMPETHAYRDSFINQYKHMAVTLKDVQTSEGYWNRSLLNSAYAPGPETSGTAFFTYGFAWGINYGLLSSDDYLSIVEAGWNYLGKTALQVDGLLGYVQPIGKNAGAGTTVSLSSTANFGVGAFLLAASQVVKLADGEMPDAPLLYVDSVIGNNDQEIQVYFNKTLNEKSATDTSKYHFSDNVKITTATLSDDQQSILLTVDEITIGSYTLELNSISAADGSFSEDGETVSFNYYGNIDVTASGYESGTSNTPLKTIDNDYSTRWSVEGIGQWIMYDLKTEYTITSVDIAMYKGDFRASYFEIVLSNDGVAFDTVYVRESSGHTSDLENYDFEDQKARYVKIIGKGNNQNQWNSYTEVNINYDIPDGITDNEEGKPALTVYPNPYQSGTLTLKSDFDLGTEWNIEIYSVTGILAYKQKCQISEANSLSLQVTGLPQGMFYIVAQSGNDRKNGFLIVK